MAAKCIDINHVAEMLLTRNIRYLGGYENTRSKIHCQCVHCGFKWTPYFNNVMRGGCAQCNRSKAQVLPKEDVLERAKKVGVDLISAYTAVTDAHMLRCRACGHEWQTALYNVIRANRPSKCPKCRQKSRGIATRLTAQEVRVILEAKGTKLLDPYVGGLHTNKYRVQCLQCAHVRTATFATLRYHSCPKCAGSLPLSSTTYAELARKYGGKCLHQGRNTNLKTLWECTYGHQFWRAYATIQGSKTFCSQCHNTRSEEICRAAMEMLFKKPFPKAKIEREGCKRKIELDGYCPEIKVAFEHQGPHHYVPDWRKDAEKRHKRTVDLDRQKANWCARNGVALITVPDLFSRTPLEALEGLIRQAVVDHPSAAAMNTSPLSLDTLRDMPVPPDNRQMLRFQRLRHIARLQGITLLDERYTGCHKPYAFKCAEGHEFTCNWYHAAYRVIRCPECRKRKRTQQNFDPGKAHQRFIRDQCYGEDVERLGRMGVPLPSSVGDFLLGIEKLSSEHQDFIERYEWLGNAGAGVKWCFAARYRGLLGGVVLLSEPYRYEKIDHRNTECLIQRGACAAWTPKNLGSKLIAYACDWMVANTDKRVFFAYADPAAGEIGTIYQACNFTYLGQFPKRVYWHNGQIKSAQTVKRTRRLLPWLARQGIKLGPECFTARGYFKWSSIPEATRKMLREHVRQKVNKWHRQDQMHGKYVHIRARSKPELKRLKATYGFKSVPYLKRPTDEPVL